MTRNELKMGLSATVDFTRSSFLASHFVMTFFTSLPLFWVQSVFDILRFTDLQNVSRPPS